VAGSDTIRIKVSRTEAADELIGVLRTHGIACDLRRPYGSEVEVTCPSRTVQADAMRQTIRGVELWLLLDDTPDEVEVRCGKEVVRVTRPDAAVAAPAEAS
jgi:hypothetical protein